MTGAKTPRCFSPARYRLRTKLCRTETLTEDPSQTVALIARKKELLCRGSGYMLARTQAPPQSLRPPLLPLEPSRRKAGDLRRSSTWRQALPPRFPGGRVDLKK